MSRPSGPSAWFSPWVWRWQAAAAVVVWSGEAVLVAAAVAAVAEYYTTAVETEPDTGSK